MDRSYSALKTVGLWFVAAGVLALLRAVIELAEPAYWSPESLLDYTAVILTSAASAVAAVALFLWWRATPIRRGSFLLLVAAVTMLLGDSLGNLLEDAFDLEIGEWLFSNVGQVSLYALMAAGIVILTVRGTYRWTGLFLLLYIAGFTFPDDGGQFLSGISLLGLGYWITRYANKRSQETAAQTART
jgi:hypothetical protein